MAMNTPVLPWAVQAEHAQGEGTQAPGHTAHQQDSQPHDEQETGLELKAVGLAPGKRIQVRWEVSVTTEKEEGGEEQKHQTKWWPATVLGLAQQQQQQQQEGQQEQEHKQDAPSSTRTQPIYELLYDKFETFDEERCRVMFTSPHCLIDLSQEDQPPSYFAWREEGDDKEYGFADDEEEEEEQEGDERAYTKEELIKLTSVSREEDREVEEEEARFLANLEPCQQRHVAAGYRSFIDGFKDFLEARFANHSGGAPTVTAEDVRGYTEQINKKLRRA